MQGGMHQAPHPLQPMGVPVPMGGHVLSRGPAQQPVGPVMPQRPRQWPLDINFASEMRASWDKQFANCQGRSRKFKRRHVKKPQQADAQPATGGTIKKRKNHRSNHRRRKAKKGVKGMLTPALTKHFVDIDLLWLRHAVALSCRFVYIVQHAMCVLAIFCTCPSIDFASQVAMQGELCRSGAADICEAALW